MFLRRPVSIFLAETGATGSLEYTAVTNTNGKVAVTLSGTGTYSASLTNAGCDGTMTLSGLPAPFNKFDVFLKVDTGEMKLAASGSIRMLAIILYLFLFDCWALDTLIGNEARNGRADARRRQLSQSLRRGAHVWRALFDVSLVQP